LRWKIIRPIWPPFFVSCFSTISIYHGDPDRARQRIAGERYGPWANWISASGRSEERLGHVFPRNHGTRGTIPLESPLPAQMMSGVTPKVCAANMFPERAQIP